MKSNLYTLSKVFTDRIFRIPDYQRGYAWKDREIQDFWNDIINLHDERFHYAGVITLEEVPLDIYKHWADDSWIIRSKSYEPYFVVDGQQRLTTSIILLQSIIDTLADDESINYTPKNKIIDRFIFESRDGGISHSFLFGYSDDLHSYEFLKSKIFAVYGKQLSEKEETVYTANLENAKRFFSEKLKKLSKDEISKIYIKLTQKLLFNIYVISDDIDVCMSFETMNNRGRPLSKLELLKNRLIYLTTKMFDENKDDIAKVRRTVNENWKMIYHQLGRNKSQPLNDDDFLMSHYSIYFHENLKVKRSQGSEFYDHRRILTYEKFLLSDYFIEQKLHCESQSESLSIAKINKYASDIGLASEAWFGIHNPKLWPELTQPEVKHLERINRIGIGSNAALLLIVFLRVKNTEQRLKILELIENLLFLFSLRMSSYYYYSYANGDYIPSDMEVIAKYINHSIDENGLIQHLSSRIDRIKTDTEFIKDIIQSFKSRGFYGWQGIKYFMYEYEAHLQEKSKQFSPKFSWEDLFDNDDVKTIEHIYPQNAKKQYWKDNFPKFTPTQRESLRNSLGNLLPMPQGKNSSLSNNDFDSKIDNGNGLGYKYGSLSEIEVANHKVWNPEAILQRGLSLLSFMEKRWSLKIGTQDQKITMLGLSFLKKEQVNK
ncbi:DUF262 domain-containing protein [Aquitalea sp. ASV11]|uniref:DUF262 domain-containing protein n=1 Tax=Aquitalea sp. ASV11 TaxID=2795103 RepID=UPI0018EE3D2E|nr:DUF262 domain-containing protein [Aquitalea sp. ASV11]